MSPGDIKVIDKPKSKWPYWILFHYKDRQWPHFEDLPHVYKKLDLLKNKIPVVTERQWAHNTALSGSRYKTQYGILYKFLNEEDRLIFIMERETGE